MNNSLSTDIRATLCRDKKDKITRATPSLQSLHLTRSLLPKINSPAKPVTTWKGITVAQKRKSVTDRFSNRRSVGWEKSFFFTMDTMTARLRNAGPNDQEDGEHNSHNHPVDPILLSQHSTAPLCSCDGLRTDIARIADVGRHCCYNSAC